MKYILYYNDVPNAHGNRPYVRRDDSTGPYSTGGYPDRVTDIWKATKFDSIEKALQYAGSFEEIMQIAFPVDLIVGNGIHPEKPYGGRHRSPGKSV